MRVSSTSVGKALTVRDALFLINQTIDEMLAEQEGDFDTDTRWAVAWFEQAGFEAADFGVAETLITAKNTSDAGLIEAGIVESGGGKMRLLRPNELPDDWDPETDTRRTVWEMVHHLIRVHSQSGEAEARELLAKLRATPSPPANSPTASTASANRRTAPRKP